MSKTKKAIRSALTGKFANKAEASAKPNEYFVDTVPIGRKVCVLCGNTILKSQRFVDDTRGSYSHFDCAAEGFTMESGE